MAIAGGTAEDVVGAAIGLVETRAGVAGATVDVVRIGAGEVQGDVERLLCWAEASAVERITKAMGSKLEMDRRSMMIRN
ncbi:MAG: hypothetical protein K8R57_10780 [Verrucomicrobia bacterium]|nr:hypothetical protein [Verrucomicrobiota bacterium]